MPVSRRQLPVLALLAAIAPTARAGSVDDERTIRRRLEEWRSAFNARDAEGACDLFAPDLSYSVPGTVRGDRETLCRKFQALFADPNLKLSYDEPVIHEIAISGSIAVVRLTWTLTSEADGRREVTTEEGMDIFAIQPDGRWSISRFIAF